MGLQRKALGVKAQLWLRTDRRNTSGVTAGRDPSIKAIHAGLECGIIGEKVSGPPACLPPLGWERREQGLAGHLHVIAALALFGDF